MKRCSVRRIHLFSLSFKFILWKWKGETPLLSIMYRSGSAWYPHSLKMEHSHKTGVAIDRSAALCSKTAYCIWIAAGGRERVGEAERLESILIRPEMSEGCSWHRCAIQLADAVSGSINNFTSVLHKDMVNQMCAWFVSRHQHMHLFKTFSP